MFYDCFTKIMSVSECDKLSHSCRVTSQLIYIVFIQTKIKSQAIGIPLGNIYTYTNQWHRCYTRSLTEIDRINKMKTSEPAICLMFSKNKYIPDAPVLMRVSFYPVNILCSAHDSHRSYNRHVAAGRFNVAHKIEHTPTAFVMRQSQHVRSNYAVISLFHFNRIRWCSGIKLIALLCGHSIV